MEPAYAFTLPSLHDDIALECRLYHPKHLVSILSEVSESRQPLNGAVIAHPYAPFGGSQDDHVVLAITQCLLKEGYIVATFNFRGAGDSEGKTSWTGSPEVDDYKSAVGLLVYYLHSLSTPAAPETLSPVMSNSSQGSIDRGKSQELDSPFPKLQIILAGYSFGSLILARLPHMSRIVQMFDSAERGTSASEIFLRARTLARQTQQTLKELQSASSPRGRKMQPGTSPHSRSRASPVVMGGEETDPMERRRSKDSRRSVDIVLDMPHRIRTRMHSRRASGTQIGQPDDFANETIAHSGPDMSVSYLLISPVLFPMTTTLLSPGLAFPKANAQAGEDGSGFLSMQKSALVLFGSSDHFTSAKKLKQWVERLSATSQGRLQWQCFQGADHFWRDDAILEELRSRIKMWTRSATI